MICQSVECWGGGGGEAANGSIRLVLLCLFLLRNL